MFELRVDAVRRIFALNLTTRLAKLSQYSCKSLFGTQLQAFAHKDYAHPKMYNSLLKRCPPRQNSSVERLKARVESLLT